jgi:hypothetical protein
VWNGRVREEPARSATRRVRAGQMVSSKLQWCSVCEKMTVEKRPRAERTKPTVSVEGGKGFWEGGLEQGVWVQGREEQQWFQKVRALVWKEPVEWRGEKTQKLREVERRCGGHSITRRQVHGDRGGQGGDEIGEGGEERDDRGGQGGGES